MKSISGNLVDIFQQKVYPAEIMIEGERIVSIKELSGTHANFLTEGGDRLESFILPGFIDAHIHIESSMLIPSEFARLAVVHGTVATVSDPHEIANVCGIPGIDFMIEDGKKTPFKFNFGAPSCVPATVFETAGAAISAGDINNLLRRDEILYLSEMMNFPGVLNKDTEVLQKIAAAKKYNKPVDGHAPGLRGNAAETYIAAGISTDHECFTKEEALDKLKNGMKILIREGSAAKNFEALIDLLNDYPDMMMFCSDDKHPDSLVEGHINQLCERAIAKEIDLFKVLKAACINPVTHYNLKVGLLRQNDFADFIVVKNLEKFEVLQTYINGVLVAENGNSLLSSGSKVQHSKTINNFSCAKKKVADFAVPVVALNSSSALSVIEALDGQLITNKIFTSPKIVNEEIVSNAETDVLKIVVVNRYNNVPVAKAFIQNFGLKKGAIASSVAHDSHNIVAVGVDDESICRAVNLIIENKGGVSIAYLNLTGRKETNAKSPLIEKTSITDNANNEVFQRGEDPLTEGFKEVILPLPVAGLMSKEDGYWVAAQYSGIDKAAKDLGSTLSAPFMTLSFMALLVIPHLKLSDKGLFDGDAFAFI